MHVKQAAANDGAKTGAKMTILQALWTAINNLRKCKPS